jgi:hypothetical protein
MIFHRNTHRKDGNTLEKQTKNIISRKQIANDLIRELSDAFLIGAITVVLSLLIFIPLIVTGLSGDSSLFNNAFLDITITIVVLVPIPGIVIACFIYLCIARLRLIRGNFLITEETLLYKDHNPGRTRWEPDNVLYFNNFKRYGVEKNPYLLATSGDKYYLVHFKNSRRILRAYPTKAYELK